MQQFENTSVYQPSQHYIKIKNNFQDDEYHDDNDEDDVEGDDDDDNVNENITL